MTLIRRFSVSTALLVLLMTVFSFTLNDNLNYRSQNLSISIAGTSSLHDWTIKSEQGQFNLTFVFTNDKPAGLASLNFSVPVESLKSGKGMMDKNTYKALKASDHKTIHFVLASGTVAPIDGVTYQIRANGKLTIAGNTRETELIAIAKYNAADKSFTVSGAKKMKMTEYGVKPPTAMLGTIKTGNDITISYTSRIVK